MLNSLVLSINRSYNVLQDPIPQNKSLATHLLYVTPFQGASKILTHTIQFHISQITSRLAAHKSSLLSSGPEPKDIIGKLLKRHDEKPDLLLNWVAKMCMSSFQAGVETTAITISSFIYNVVIHPECQGKIHAEIDAAKKAGKLSSPPQLRELKAHLPYTSACLSESLRLHPVIGMPLMRVVPEGGAQLEGYNLPAGVCESSLFGAAS